MVKAKIIVSSKGIKNFLNELDLWDFSKEDEIIITCEDGFLDAPKLGNVKKLNIHTDCIFETKASAEQLRRLYKVCCILEEQPICLSFSDMDNYITIITAVI